MTQLRFTLLTAAATAAVLAGCGSGSTGSGTGQEPAAALASDRGMVQFARCMRAHGVNMPDPFHRPGHEGLSIGLPERGPATTAAYGVCGHYLQATIELKQRNMGQTLTPAVRLGLIHYAECMRGHAVPMLDPGPFGQLSLGNVPGISGTFGRYSPQFHSADEACRHVLPRSVHDDGSGP